MPSRSLEASRADTGRRSTASTWSLSIVRILAGALAAAAFIANGGLQLGSPRSSRTRRSRDRRAAVAAAILCSGCGARLHGGVAAGRPVAGLRRSPRSRSRGRCTRPTGGSRPNRTLAYLATFAAGIAAVRLARERWPAVVTACCWRWRPSAYTALATKVAPGWLAEDEIYGRLREPYGYWNAVGVTAAMAHRCACGSGPATSSRPGPQRARLAGPWAVRGDDAAELLAREHPGRGRGHRPLVHLRAAAPRASQCCCRPRWRRRRQRPGPSRRAPSPTTASRSRTARTRASRSA